MDLLNLLKLILLFIVIIFKLFIVSGEIWTRRIFTSDSGNKLYTFSYKALVCSTPGSVLKL